MFSFSVEANPRLGTSVTLERPALMLLRRLPPPHFHQQAIEHVVHLLLHEMICIIRSNLQQLRVFFYVQLQLEASTSNASMDSNGLDVDVETMVKVSNNQLSSWSSWYA